MISVSAGGNHTCALLDDHSVECWGEDISLGSSAIPQPANRLFSKVSVGGLGVCGLLLADNTPLCWGHNNVSASGLYNTIPMTDIYAGGLISCGIRQDNGNLYCWSAGNEVFTTGFPQYSALGSSKHKSNFDILCMWYTSG